MVRKSRFLEILATCSRSDKDDRTFVISGEMESLKNSLMANHIAGACNPLVMQGSRSGMEKLHSLLGSISCRDFNTLF